MSERLHIDESSLPPAMSAPAPSAGGEQPPWPSGLRNPAVLTPPKRGRTDPRTIAIVGGLCAAIVLAGAAYAGGKASGPSEAEISARIQRAVAADRAKRAAPPKADQRLGARATDERPQPTSPKGRP